MKTTVSIFKKITLGLLVAGSLAACNKNKTADTATPAAAPAADVKELIVYVNSDTLFAKYSYAKDVNKQITDKSNAAQNQLTSKGQAFQREVAEYQKSQPTLSADQRQTTEKRLQREQQELQQYQQNAGAQLQSDKAAQVEKLYDKIADFTKQYAKGKGYKMVLTYSKANGAILYGDASLDVTNDVVKGLNDAYTKDKK